MNTSCAGLLRASCLFLFFFNDTAPTEIYSLPLHDALPIYWTFAVATFAIAGFPPAAGDRKCRSEEHTSELQSPCNIVCRLLLEKKDSKGKGVSRGGLKVLRIAGGTGWHLREIGFLPEGEQRFTVVPRQSRNAHRQLFFNDTATTEIYTLSLHDALPI